MDTIMTTQQSSAHPALSWRSVLAGLVLSIFAFVTLLVLGVAVGGYSLQDGASLQNSGVYSGLWVTFSAAIALFGASYFASRITPYVSNKIGLVQGAVVAAVFFGFVMWQAAGIVGSVTSGASSLIGKAGSAISAAGPSIAQASQTDTGAMLTEDALSNLQLKGDPATVAQGLAGRLARGNVEGAKSYLASHSSLSEAEINQRIEDLQAKTQAALIQAREQGAKAMQVAGLSMFMMLIVGMVASALGGQLGVRTNRTEPLIATQGVSVRGREPAYT